MLTRIPLCLSSSQSQVTGGADPVPVVIPTVTKETLNTALALESTGVVIGEDVVQEAATTAVSVSVSTIGDAVAPVLADLSAAVSAKVAADTGINATDLVVVKVEVVVGGTDPSSSPSTKNGECSVTD